MKIPLSDESLQEVPAFCNRWGIQEFALFGSVLRDDYSTNSDIDVLIEFQPGVFQGVDEWIEMRDELEALFGRRVDLVRKGGLKNPFRRAEILQSRRVLYAA